MITEFTPEDIECVVNKLSHTLVGHRPTITKGQLLQLNTQLDIGKLKLLNMIYTFQITCSVVLPRTRYNQLPVTVQSIKEAEKLITDILERKLQRSSYIQLPLTLQKLLRYLFVEGSLGIPRRYIRDLITETVWEHKVTSSKTYCSRCYNTIDSGGLCKTCRNKIEKCVEYTVEDFEVSGSTVEPFQYQFKDWVVDVSKFGVYQFKKQVKCIERYTGLLPFKEFQNFSSILG